MAQAQQSRRYLKLGAFVLASILVLIILIVLIGSGRIGRQRVAMETYFDESVQGLDVGSKVKYRGVTVGAVTGIGFTWARYELDRPPAERRQYVMVEAEVEGNLLGGRFMTLSDRQRLLDQQIERGLRVRLASQGLTGTMYLEVDFVDPKTATSMLAKSWEPQSVYVPSTPSTQTQIMDALSEVIQRLRKLDVEATITSLRRVLESASTQLDQMPLERIGRETQALLAELRQTNDALAKKIERVPLDRIGNDLAQLVNEIRASNEALSRVLGDPALAKVPADLAAAVAGARETFDNPALRQLPADAQAAVAKLRQAVENPDLGRTITNLQRSVGRLERILVGREGDIGTTLENLRVITENLRDTTESARRYPSQLILGEPPAPTVPPALSPRPSR
jgi:paraquat-inducible protein B